MATSPGSIVSPGQGGSPYAAGLAVAPSVCQARPSGPGITSSTFTVGNVSTITGPIPGLTAGAAHGIQAFAAYLNSVGGVCGRKLVVKVADDNLDASQNATATQSLAGSVFAFVGSYSGVDQGGASVLQSSGVPDVGEALSSQRFNLPNNFSPQPIPPTGFSDGPFLFWKHKYPGAVSKFAVLTENQSEAVAETQSYVDAANRAGYRFVFTDNNIEPTQTDFSADAQAMKSKSAQGLIFLAVPSVYAEVARALQNAGLKMPLASYSENAYDPTFLADAGTAANGASILSYYAMYDGEDAGSVPIVAMFDRWYEALYGNPPDEFAADGWLSGMLFVEGLNVGGGLTRGQLLSGLGKVTSFDGSGLEAVANPAAKKAPSCYIVIDVVNGKFVRDPDVPRTGFDCAYT